MADPLPRPAAGAEPPAGEDAVRTRIPSIADLSFEDLARVRRSGDTVLDHCLEQLVADTAAPAPEPMSFNSAL
nr:FXSXX-COOH protein [Micromonospora sp. DSM 115978]